MPDSTLSALGNIIIKVRRLTRSPSTAQITDAQIRDYVNTFILYDFPPDIRDTALKQVFSFYTQPYVDTYDTDDVDPNSPMYNFKNRVVTLNPPVYIAGSLVTLSLSRQQFYGFYPITNTLSNTNQSGDGVNDTFAGTLSYIPVLQRSVIFSSIDAANNGLQVVDDPLTPTLGSLIVPNNPVPVGVINYVTGVYNFTFPAAPAAAAPVNSQSYPYVPNKPNSVLFFDNKFVLRPVPDQVYRVDVEAIVRPDELINANDLPLLSQWSQYIAYGTAKKIFEDRMDQESIQNIMPEFEAQKDLIQYRMEAQKSNQRIPTIYSEMTTFGPSGSNWGTGGNF